MTAPDFALKDEKGADWRLSDAIGNIVVLLFYPQNETLVCTKQLCAVRDRWQEYLETNAIIVGISPAEPDTHTAFADKYYLPIPLLSDENRKVTSAYVKHSFYPINFTRGVVVIDTHGIIRTRQIMLRAFRPKDDDVIAAIYAARGDAMDERYQKLKKKIRKVIVG